MNEIFAVDPEGPSDLRDLRALLDRFGLANGRLIARYPQDWRQMLEYHFRHLSGLDRSRLSRLLQLHRDSLLDSAEPYFRSRSWTENVSAAMRDGSRFGRVLARSPNADGLETLESFLWSSEEDLSLSREEYIPMTSRAYIEACRPLFELSSEIHLVDRFFRLRFDGVQRDHKRWRLLVEFLREINRIGRCERFVVYFDCPAHLPEDDFLIQLESDLNLVRSDAGLGAGGLEVGYDVRDDFDHGRYIFSVKGGLQFDNGFAVGHREKNHVRWMSTSGLRPLLIKYGLAI
jgi:hypothetical protein